MYLIYSTQTGSSFPSISSVSSVYELLSHYSLMSTSNSLWTSSSFILIAFLFMFPKCTDSNLVKEDTCTQIRSFLITLSVRLPTYIWNTQSERFLTFVCTLLVAVISNRLYEFVASLWTLQQKRWVEMKHKSAQNGQADEATFREIE